MRVPSTSPGLVQKAPRIMRFTDTPPMKGRGRQKLFTRPQIRRTQLTVAFGGTADRAGILSARVNGVEQGKKTVAAGGTFRLVLPVEEGRNEIELLFTDSAGTAAGTR